METNHNTPLDICKEKWKNFEEKEQKINEKIEKLEHVTLGNGLPGLDECARRNREQLEKHETRIERMETKLRMVDIYFGCCIFLFTLIFFGVQPSTILSWIIKAL